MKREGGIQKKTNSNSFKIIYLYVISIDIIIIKDRKQNADAMS